MDKDEERGKIRSCARAAVYQFAKKFQSIPFNYMSESDIQSELLVTLRNQLNWLIEIKHPLDLMAENEVNFRKTINLVNTQYSDRIIDIVCLDPELAKAEISKKENQHRRLSDFLWRLPVLIGMEIKLVRFDDFSKGIDICRRDAQKLKDFAMDQKNELNWLMLCFFHNSEAMVRMVKNEPHEDIYESIPDYDKIYLFDSEKILQVN